ncbi:MAG: hypothetical protein IPM13_10390 [Phycisphaerales bacterium]|nr:hypothetical protein [Phycisphaerales bacterium]
MTISAIECVDAYEAIQIARENEDACAITLAGRRYATLRAEAERLELAGVEFAFLSEITRGDGRRCLVTVPVND